MGWLQEILRAIFKSLIGETAQEKEYRIAIDDAERLYDVGWQYKSSQDLEKAISLCHRADDHNSPSAMMVFKKYRLLAMSFIKLSFIIVSQYKENMEAIAKKGQQVKDLELDELQDKKIEILERIRNQRKEIDEVNRLQRSRKNDQLLEDLKADQEKLLDEEHKISDLVQGKKNFRKRIHEQQAHLASKMEEYNLRIVKYFSQAKEVQGLNQEENVRRELLLKRNWDDLRKIQEDMAKAQERFASEMMVDLTELTHSHEESEPSPAATPAESSNNPADKLAADLSAGEAGGQESNSNEGDKKDSDSSWIKPE